MYFIKKIFVAVSCLLAFSLSYATAKSWPDPIVPVGLSVSNETSQLIPVQANKGAYLVTQILPDTQNIAITGSTSGWHPCPGYDGSDNGIIIFGDPARPTGNCIVRVCTLAPLALIQAGDGSSGYTCHVVSATTHQLEIITPTNQRH